MDCKLESLLVAIQWLLCSLEMSLIKTFFNSVKVKTTHLRGDHGHLSSYETFYTSSVFIADIIPVFQVRSLRSFCPLHSFLHFFAY